MSKEQLKDELLQVTGMEQSNRVGIPINEKTLAEELNLIR